MPDDQSSAKPGDSARNTVPNGGNVSIKPLVGLTEPASIELLEVSVSHPEDSLLTQLANWVGERTDQPPVLLDLYGTLIAWAPQRAAVATSHDRMPAATAAVLDFAATATEVSQIETGITAIWPAYEGDLLFGFMLDEYDPRRAKELAKQYQRVMSLSGRLVRVATRIHQPLQHPPSLTSQIGERLRDRSRLADREEFASDQLELIVRLYESCGQRISEYAIARREYVLIWVIVLLLTGEMALLLVDLLATTGN